MAPAIKVDNLSKSYRLGLTHSGSIRETVNRFAGKLLRAAGSGTANNEAGKQDLFWALKDVGFEVQPGEVVGIIGRNGAGKSTLLKILSRITSPSHGRVEMRGRVASLLEVGTGFHPELSGRENVFLNGTILGMTKSEVEKQFDAIVNFSGVEKFIDTPVKRYSSGMKVRLGFAVAAHLEPEILIVDEVLAVGDMEFQQRCLGKMNDVAASGRTILFVSHNMSAVGQLCRTGIVLVNGTTTGSMPIRSAIEEYMKLGSCSDAPGTYSNNASNDADFAIAKVVVSQCGQHGMSAVLHDREIDISFDLRFAEETRRPLRLSIAVCDNGMRKVFTSATTVPPRTATEASAIMSIPSRFLMPGQYSLIAGLQETTGAPLDVHRFVCPFQIEDAGDKMRLKPAADYGVVFAHCDWRFTNQSSQSPQ